MKNKGFTLIELLAVIVILAVIALIAYPVITGIVENSKKNSALRSIEGYVEAANNATVIYDVDNSKGINVTVDKHTFTSDEDILEFSKIKVKGTIPTYSYIDFNTKTKAVSEGHFCINGYSVIYENNQAKISNTNYCLDEDSSNKAEIGTEWVFDYNGVDGNSPSVQSFEVPNKGLYKLEVWGAQGGWSGGQGGYSTGYVYLKSHDMLSIVVGGAGEGDGSHAYRTGGYNGGGNALSNDDNHTRQGSGGGATHIAKSNGNYTTLSSYGSADVAKDYVLIVAGGGGGKSTNSVLWPSVAGGAGGGVTGESGSAVYESSTLFQGYGGTQTEGGGNTLNQTKASFGQGADGIAAGGGGGWYGGGNASYSGAGGSGYIGGVPEITYKKTVYSPSTTVGGHTGNGYAKITLISY